MSLAFLNRGLSVQHTRESEAAAPTGIPGSVARGLLGACEATTIFASGLVVSWLVAPWWDSAWARHIDTVGFGTILCLNLIWLFGGYRGESIASSYASLARGLAGWAGAVGLLVALGSMVGIEGAYKSVWFSEWVVVATLGIVVLRTLFCVGLGRCGIAAAAPRRVAVVGCGAEGQELLTRYATTRPAGIEIIGVFEERSARAPQFCWTFPVCGNIDTLAEFVRDNRVDDVIVAFPLSAHERLHELLARLQIFPVNVHVLAETLDLGETGASLERLGGAPVVRVMQKPLSQSQAILKEIEDRVLGALILGMLMPVFAAIALAIKLDSPGPVFFRQFRFGYGNRLIEVLKFRTMRVEATDANAERLTSRDDPRVTRLGKFLRRTSLDELPQFINVVRGEMSIVGPRPHARSAKAGGILYPHAVEAYAARHKVKPGITGLAQINGWRGETQTVEQIRQRVAHDMVYIRNWSLWLDLKIIVITAFTGFSGRDAY